MLQAISDKEVLTDIKPNLASYLRVSQGKYFSRDGGLYYTMSKVEGRKIMDTP